MAKKRITKKVIEKVTQEDAVQAFAELSTAQSSNNKMQAEIEILVTKIREQFQDKLIANQVIINEKSEILEAFLKLNPGVLGDKRSIDLTHGTIGYRKSTPALKNMKGFTWPAVVNLVKEFISESYVRKTEEVAKDLLLADRDLPLTKLFEYKNNDPIFSLPEEERPKLSSLFAKCGVKVNQDDLFFIDPKKEEPLKPH